MVIINAEVIVDAAGVEDAGAEGVMAGEVVETSLALQTIRRRRLRGSGRTRIRQHGRIIVGRTRGERRWLGVGFRGSRCIVLM